MKKLLAALLLATLASCASPIKRGETVPINEKQAYVIIAIDGNMPLSEARYCFGICMAWYSFGEERTKGVHIYPVSVGSTFKINELYSGSKVAVFKGREIEIKTPGVYYFGLIHSIDQRLFFKPEPSPSILKDLLAKYGNELTQLRPINFTWPGN